jgi:hypothetical protein
VNGEAQLVLATLSAAVTVIFEETGNVRPGLGKGHEHFGWLDGVSQLGVKGLSDPFPGQRLIDPGLSRWLSRRSRTSALRMDEQRLIYGVPQAESVSP